MPEASNSSVIPKAPLVQEIVDSKSVWRSADSVRSLVLKREETRQLLEAFKLRCKADDPHKRRFPLWEHLQASAMRLEAETLDGPPEAVDKQWDYRMLQWEYPRLVWEADESSLDDPLNGPLSLGEHLLASATPLERSEFVKYYRTVMSVSSVATLDGPREAVESSPENEDHKARGLLRLLATVVTENGSIEFKDDKAVTWFTATSADTKFCSRRQVSNAAGRVFSLVDGKFFTAHSEHTGYVDGEKAFIARHTSTNHKDTNMNIQVFLDKDHVMDTEVEEQEKIINALLVSHEYEKLDALLKEMVADAENKPNEKGKAKKKESVLNVVGDWLKKNLKISEQDSEKIIAQMLPHDDKDKFVVEIASGVDPKLTISLIAAVDSMQSHHKSKLATRVAKGSLKAAPALVVAGGKGIYDCFTS